MTERADRCDWLGQAARESVQVPRWCRWDPDGERLADMEPLINLHVAKHGIASRSVDSVFWRRIEKGYFGNFTKYRLCDLWLNRGAGRRLEKRFRSIKDEDGALRCVRVLTHCELGFNGCPKWNIP